MAGPPGLEPGLAGPKPAVLPIRRQANESTRRNILERLRTDNRQGAHDRRYCSQSNMSVAHCHVVMPVRRCKCRGNRAACRDPLTSLYDEVRPILRQRGVGARFAGMIGGVWRSLVAHLVRDEGVVGSNPTTPTNQNNDLGDFRAIFRGTPYVQRT